MTKIVSDLARVPAPALETRVADCLQVLGFTSADIGMPPDGPTARARANPDAWGYLNRGVAGMTQMLE
ncbi:MAG: hypothetical protein ACKO6D_11515, partial [Rubrivivax sp.]